MVDLYDLKLMAAGIRGGESANVTTTDLDHWPAGGIDEHIAQLDFETSSIANEESIFCSMAAMDPTLISTDSLDMEQLRQRCETKKNDYKLTFEDSGQWTTSGFGTGTSPSGVAAGHLDEEDASASSEERKRQSADLLLNNDAAGDFPNGTLTTWGRIKSVVEPPFDPKTNSMPSVNFRTSQQPSDQQRRPTRLLANFVERQAATSGSNSPPHDYEYSEQYLGDGRYMDLNQNEIGYVPASTAPIQRSANSGAPKNSLPPVPPTSLISPQETPKSTKDRWQEAHHHQRRLGTAPPRRTFATLDSGPAPDLNFLSLPFKVPSVCRSSASLDEIFRHAEQQSNSPKISASKTEAFLSEILSADTSGVANATARLFQQPSPAYTTPQSTLTHLAAPDSGLGSSSGNNSGSTTTGSGPSHVEDWPSLSILLPKHVVEVYSFFKSNTNLLSAAPSSASSSADNSIERKSRSACRTCFGLRSNCLHPPASFAHSQRELCDCVTTDGSLAARKISSLSVGASVAMDRLDAGRQKCRRQAKLRAEELSVIGMPIYDAKRQLIERVVEGVAELVRGGSALVLYSGLERLLSDGLLEGSSVWRMIVAVTRPGKATNSIYDLVQKLDASEKRENSRVQAFFRELLRLHSLDGWLSYTVLKEKQLAGLYVDTAFLLRAHTSYRTLFLRLIESLELLSVLSQCERSLTNIASSSGAIKHFNSTTFDASRLASDSRVPKSSSIPSNLRDIRSLSSSDRRKRSRIPISLQCRSRSVNLACSAPASHTACSTTLPRSRSSLGTARVRADIVGDGPGGWLPLRSGERVRLLSLRNGWSWVSRSSWKTAIQHGLPINGTVPTEFLEL